LSDPLKEVEEARFHRAILLIRIYQLLLEFRNFEADWSFVGKRLI